MFVGTWEDNAVFGFERGTLGVDEDGVFTGDLCVPVKILGYLGKRAVGALEEGKGVGLCVKKGTEGVVDLAKVKGKSGNTIGHLVQGLYDNELMYKVAVYRYFLRVSACYVEVPQKRQKDGMLLDSFDKFIATSSPEVVAEWLGVTLEDAEVFLKGRLVRTDELPEDEEEKNFVPYVKLYVGSKGEKKVTKPRKDLDLCGEGLRLMPLYVLRKYRDGLIEKARKGIVKVRFLKDNQEVRELCTTLDLKVIEDLYGEGSNFVKRLSNFGEMVDKDGFFKVSCQEGRGYIRVPEVGASRYDLSGVRSINYFRVVGVEEDVEPDMSFVDVDLGAAHVAFCESVGGMKESEAKDLVEEMGLFGLDVKDWMGVGRSGEVVWKVDPSGIGLENWYEKYKTVLGTGFEKEVALFMMSNPEWFGGFSGGEVEEEGQESLEVNGRESLGLL